MIYLLSCLSVTGQPPVISQTRHFQRAVSRPETIPTQIIPDTVQWYAFQEASRHILQNDRIGHAYSREEPASLDSPLALESPPMLPRESTIFLFEDGVSSTQAGHTNVQSRLCNKTKCSPMIRFNSFQFAIPSFQYGIICSVFMSFHTLTYSLSNHH